jgi:hypothetical protein
VTRFSKASVLATIEAELSVLDREYGFIEWIGHAQIANVARKVNRERGTLRFADIEEEVAIAYGQYDALNRIHDRITEGQLAEPEAR